LTATRPTAVNLKWAVDRCLALVRSHAEQDGVTRHAELAELARSIHRDDVASCRALGHCGASILRQHARDGRIRLLTHCNAGALATGGYGTALGVVRACVELGLNVQIFADETRPYLQGARLTAWELVRDGIDVTVIADDMAAHCMQRGLIDAVVVGADRIAANGDVANKIGTYGVACLAHAHAIPFYVAAPMSTIDERTECGSEIPIEERARAELCELGGRVLVPSEARVLNPGFDVTPARLIKAIFTERGVMTPPIGP
jgi:methylthioribose-1-phosphate isomerase